MYGKLMVDTQAGFGEYLVGWVEGSKIGLKGLLSALPKLIGLNFIFQEKGLNENNYCGCYDVTC